MNTQNLLSIVDSLHEEPTRPLNDHVLILDGLNTLIRNFSVSLTINSDGNHVGGLQGFLKSLGSMHRMFNPTRIIIVWDGIGGAQNRKNLDSHYKAQRAHASVIHYDLYEDKKSEMQSIQDQADRLLDYLACLPVTYIQIDKLEADDVIAYLATNFSRAGRKVTIVSSDKDFLQLIDSNVEVYSPIRKVVFDHTAAGAFLQVLPENYNIVKTVLGDMSDGLTGVRGVGLRGLIKGFPELVTDPKLTLDKLFDLCSERYIATKKAVFGKMLAGWTTIEHNYKLMDLHETVLDEEEKEIVHEILKYPVPPLRIGPFLHLLEEDKFEFMKDTEGWLCQFSSLVQEKKS